MSFKRTVMRYAHTNGHTCCTYTENGEKLITCGADGDMRTWQGIEDDDPTSTCLGEFILCVVQYENRLLVSNDVNVVQAYAFPEIDRDGIIFRFTAPATCIRVNKTYIAAGSEGMVIKVLLRQKSEEVFDLTGHNGPILHIDLSPKNLLASASGDGTLKVWDLVEKSEIKTIANDLPETKTFDTTSYYNTPSFEPTSGNYLAYPRGKNIIVLSTSTWGEHVSLSDDNVNSDYSCCCFSQCGQYLAAGTTSGEISVWDFIKKESIRCETLNKESQSITTIAWNPKKNGEFAYCDISGQLGTILNSKISSKSTVDGLIYDQADEMDFGDLQFEAESENDINGDGDDDNENCISLERLKNETMKECGLPTDDVDKDDDNKSESSLSVNRYIEKAKIYQAQAPFQPGSTPQNLEHRYLVWNNIGIVRAYTTNAESSIDVEFHDISTHHSLHMSNYLNHTMASLSSTVLALSGDTSSKLVCICLGTSGSREWSAELPDCEGILSVIATNSLVAVATDNRVLRIFSAMGTQREVISLPGNVVALAGQDNKIMVVYHSAPPNEDQHLSVMLLQAFGLTLRCRDVRLPLSPGKKLSWIGYSDCGSPCSFDSNGLLQMYNLKTNCWYPICNTLQHTQSVSNNYFIIDILEKNQIVQAVLCRGATYPMTNPRPMVAELPMQLPFCEIDSEKSMLEELLIRSSNFHVENSAKLMKETAIKLFALSCRAEMEARAKELIEMIASPQLLPLAVKYASKLGRIHLADKLSELLPHLEEQETEREKQMREAEVETVNILQNSPLNTGLMLLQKPRDSNPSQITPKPLLITQQRRNPFKRSSVGTPTSSKENPLKHLTEKAIGFDSKKPDTLEDEIYLSMDTVNPPINLGTTLHSLDIIPENDENEAKNDNKKSTSSAPVFMNWFKENREDLKKKHPDVSAAELTKLAMKEFKTNSLTNKQSSTVNKRKLEDESSDKQQSGIAKLAKFGFKK